VVSSTPRPHFTPGKDPIPILHGAGWAPGLVWMVGKSRPHRDSIPDRPARSSVAMPTELPGPPHRFCTLRNKQEGLNRKWVFFALLTYLPQDMSQKSAGL